MRPRDRRDVSFYNICLFLLIFRLEYEGMGNTSSHTDMVTYAVDRYAYYVCFKCQKAYYGGEARCDAELGDIYNPQELVCGGCSDVARAQVRILSCIILHHIDDGIE